MEVSSDGDEPVPSSFDTDEGGESDHGIGDDPPASLRGPGLELGLAEHANSLVASMNSWSTGPMNCTPDLSHYCSVPNDEKVFFMPVPGCLLPPPQPYWLSATLTSTKGVGTYLLLYTSMKKDAEYDRDLHTCPPRLVDEEVKVKATFWFTWLSLAASLLLLAKRIMGFSIETLWQHYECWWKGMSMAAWGANLVLAMAQAGANRNAKMIDANQKAVAEAMPRAMRLLETKEDNFVKSAKLTGGAWVLTLGLFTVSHLGPALLLCGGWLLAGAVLLWQSMVVTRFERASRGAEAKLNMLPLLVLPLAILFGSAVQYCAAAATFWYTEDGYKAAVWTAITERQSSVYTQANC